MKKPNIYPDRSQELLALFEQAGNNSKVMCVPIDYAKKDHLAIETIVAFCTHRLFPFMLFSLPLIAVKRNKT